MTTCNWIPAGLAAFILLVTPVVQAQTAEDQATARTLFDEARKLVKAGQVADACPKFEAAAKLYSSPGILLNLGDCYEKTGRTASAWNEFSESAAAAERTDRHDQAAEARRRQAALKPKLARLTIVVPHEVAGLVVTRDETDLSSAAWGSAIPVDSGAHRIRASAAGYDAWETSVTVSTPGQTISVEVPELKASPVAAAAAPAPLEASQATTANSTPAFGEPAPAAHRSRAAGIALLGAGAVVGIGGGILMGIEAGRASSARSSDSKANYNSATDEYNSTKVPYAIGIAGAAVGGAAAVTGLVLLVTGHGGNASATTVGTASPWMTPGGGGVSVGGSW